MSEIPQKPFETITIDDFNQICRLCPSKTNLTELYNNPETIIMLETCTQLQIDENDGLPNKICENCSKKLTETYNFISTCKLFDETYRKCLEPPLTLETIYLEPGIKEEFLDVEIKQETDDTPEITNTTHNTQNLGENILMEFVRLGKQRGCDSLLMRHFMEREGPERLSIHIMLTSFVKTNLPEDYNGFMEQCRREMTDEYCASASHATLTLRKNPELNLELRYGRITSSKMYAVSCAENPDEYFIENIIGFYKMSDAKTLKKTTDTIVQKIEKQLNVKIHKRGLILNGNYPEFVAKLDGVTTDAVIKMKYPKNRKDYLKFIDEDKNLTPKTKTEMHLLMLVANLRTSYLCVIDPSFANTNTIVQVDFNERYFAEILRKCQNFWRVKIFPVLCETVS